METWYLSPLCLCTEKRVSSSHYQLCLQANIDIDTKEFSVTALFQSIRFGNFENVNKLLESGAKVSPFNIIHAIHCKNDDNINKLWSSYGQKTNILDILSSHQSSVDEKCGTFLKECHADLTFDDFEAALRWGYIKEAEIILEVGFTDQDQRKKIKTFSEAIQAAEKCDWPAA
jgi:hypothetical protein